MPAHDAVIVGAGPAGATAARTLARAGARVLLLDRAPLGRDKPCGGGLTPRAYLGLEVPIDDLVAARVRNAQLRRGAGPSLRVDLGDGAVWMVRRRDFDRRLAEAAAEAGAELHDGDSVDAIEPEAGGGVTIRTKGGAHRAAVLLLATGAEAPLRRSLGFEAPTERMAVALELEGPAHCASLTGDHFIFDYAVPGGYAWAFPKGDWWNAGILTVRAGVAPELRGRLATFMASIGLHFHDPRASPNLATGRRIPFWLRPATVHRGPTALLGDAAGLADPLFGEGIAQAIHSGRLSAAATLDVLHGRAADLSGYPDSLRTVLGRHLWRTRQAGRVLYAAPALALRGLGAVSAARHAATHVATEPFRSLR
ncbi:MAG: NAD(P)/FAD-dependent oxidoreductase [Candidatus Dormibacteria bacterium]